MTSFSQTNVAITLDVPAVEQERASSVIDAILQPAVQLLMQDAQLDRRISLPARPSRELGDCADTSASTSRTVSRTASPARGSPLRHGATSTSEMDIDRDAVHTAPATTANDDARTTSASAPENPFVGLSTKNTGSLHELLQATAATPFFATLSQLDARDLCALERVSWLSCCFVNALTRTRRLANRCDRY
jgi:hypothetical protein